MWWSVFLLVVMCKPPFLSYNDAHYGSAHSHCVVQCSFSICHRYEYHFINENKTWEEAQSYCREKYTDLAKVYDMSDMKRLKTSAGSSAEAWIGLKSERGGTRMWHWSQPGKVYSENTANWQQGEPNDWGGHEDCAIILEDKKWQDANCIAPHTFICYDESSSENIHWIDETKTWTEAQSYCRENHTDLVSGDQLEGLDTGGVPHNDSQCSFSTCHRYEYHFINEYKTWEEAQSYCREKYTDLAKVYDMTDMKRLKSSAGVQLEPGLG
ncbi:hypothetical protein INR49_017226 [Caranx melampygus]|nr:hypothetical protein INR49_017226 [Caranx melampygus]